MTSRWSMRGREVLGACLALGIAMAADAGTPRFDALQERLRTERIGSVEALVAALPAELRTYYTLAFSSRSLQSATFANPRAILYGSDANFVVTFNGDSSGRGYAAVETMEFDATENRFVFREISFAPDGDPAARTVSAPNPARCVACHGAPARPIWDVPPAWPGIYGERYGAGLSPAEANGIRAFLALQPAHPRYRHLLAAARFAERETYVPSAHAIYNGATVESPNERLSVLLATLNVRSILAELVSQPGFAAHRYVMLATAGTNCGAPASFYPEHEQAAIQRDYEAFRQLTLTAAERQAEIKTLRRANRGHAVRRSGDPTELQSLRFVTERSLGLSTANWTLALERGTYDLSAPEGALTLGEALFGIVAAQDHGLRDLAAYRDFSADDAYCEHLRRESRRAIAAWYALHPLAATGRLASPEASSTGSAAAHPAPLESCVSCHSSDVAPLLPFADPTALAARLGEGHYPRGRLLDEILYRLAPEAGADRMPRGTNLGPDEQRELEAYFLSLAAARPARN